MKIETQTTLKTLSLSAHEWQLYSTMPRVHIAARNINAGVAKAINKVMGSQVNTWTEAYNAAEAVLAKYSNFGALDTEPRATLCHILDKVYGPQPERY